MIATRLVTVEDLEAMGEDARFELIRGELRPITPVGIPHGIIVLRVGVPLYEVVEDHRLGALAVGDVGTILERGPDTLLAPDIAFWMGENRPVTEIPQGVARVLPDLVVEVASPSERK